MSIKDSNFNIQISMSMNKSCDNLDYFGFTDLIKKKLNEDELNLKLKQVREVTNCNEELAIINLHDCNYNVEYAINKILTHESSNEGEWKTKKGKQKKIIPKDKVLNKNQDQIKEKLQNSMESVTEVNESSDKKLLQFTKKENVCGKTFKNFNLTKRLNSNYIIPDHHRKNTLKPEINFLINGKWNEKTIIIENSKFPPMPVKDIIMLKNEKGESIDRSSPVQTYEKKENIEDVSIVFKTHCTTKPPPKVLCSLVAPVQIINNKTTKPHSLPKFKFGDTDFNEDIKKPDVTSKINNSDLKFVDIEDHSIIKVGPSQKIIHNQPICNFPSDIFNANPSYFNSPNFPMKTQSNLCNNNVKPEFNMKKPIDIAEYPYMNVLQHPGPTNLPNCNSNMSSINSFNSSMSPKEINTNSKPHDMFLNHSSQLGYSPQTNVNHGKSTIYLVPNVMVNPISGLYMSVNNPLPTSALSPPMAPIASQFNMPQQQPPPMYYDESLQSDDIANKNHMAMRQYNQNRNFQRFKKNGPDITDEISIKTDHFSKPSMKTMPSIPMNQNSISKQIPYSFPLFISSASVASHNQSQMFINNPINSNSFSPFSNGFQPHQESNNNEHARKRNVQVQNGNFHGKAWS